MTASETPTISARLEDGTKIEMLYTGGETAFACFQGGELTTRPSIDGPRGRRLVPWSPENNLLTHRVLLLPSAVEEYGSDDELFERIHGFIHRYVDLEPAFELAASAYVLLTWRFDDFAELPYLRARGTFGSGKSRFLTTLGSLCYKPIFASGASTVSPLFRMLDAIEGTLILDEADFRLSDERAEITKILNNGNAKGFPVLRSEQNPQKEFNPRAFTVYGPKVIATRHAFQDEALESRCLTEEMGLRPVRRDIPLSLPEDFHDQATRLRNVLLRYRFEHAGRRPEVVSFEGVSPRRSQVLSPLLQVSPASIRHELHEALLWLAGGTRQPQTTPPEVVVLEAVRELQGRGEQLTVGAIAMEAAADNASELSARRIGHLLRHRLGLLPERRGGVYELPEGELSKLGHLLHRYGLGKDVEDVRDVTETSKGAEQTLFGA